jgi:hypothetical protein
MYFVQQLLCQFRAVGSCSHRGHLIDIWTDNMLDVAHQIAIEDMSMVCCALIPDKGPESMVHMLTMMLIWENI